MLLVILAQIFCSRGRPVELLLDVLQILLDVQQDSTGRPLEFCKFASNVLELLISSRNAIKISTGRPVEFLLDVPQNLLDVQQNCSTGHPLEQKIWRIIHKVVIFDQNCHKSENLKILNFSAKKMVKIKNLPNQHVSQVSVNKLTDRS